MFFLKHKIHVVTKDDHRFPWRMRALDDCPDVLYVLGNIDILNNFSIAIVGSRSCDEYGKKITKDFAKELAMNGVCVVSGLAEGVDTFAHESALEVGGKTIAIIGSGFKNIYPSSNEKLFYEIIESGGAIISEYLPDEAPRRFFFPRRNRLVACMTEGTLVTQAREKSGALITAKIASEYNKKLFVVPSDLDNHKAIGSNLLMQKGAKVVLKVEDILEEFSYHKFQNEKKDKIEKDEKIIPEKYIDTYKILENGTINLNEICRTSQKAIEQTISDLTMLEMYGYVKQLPGNFYQIT